MGSPLSEQDRADNEFQHIVTITRPFWMKKTEVTRKEWGVITSYGLYEDESYPQIGGYETEFSKHPMSGVSFFDILAYANVLSIKEGFSACYNLSICQSEDDEFICNGVLDFSLDCDGYRLPTEAEWEYAYRAGTITPFYNGSTLTDLDRIAWHGHGALFYEDQKIGSPHPVAQKEPNAWGLFDMSGNVSEWVWGPTDDDDGDYPNHPRIDPKSPIIFSQKRDFFVIIRGCDYRDDMDECRAARRMSDHPSHRQDYI